MTILTSIRFRRDLWARAKAATVKNETTLQNLANRGLELALAEIGG